MESRSQRTSVPQIFLGDIHIGGYDDMNAMNQNGKLAELID
jgi:glutaredoxin 3